jgi:opacity protein-like surface antigen
MARKSLWTLAALTPVAVAPAVIAQQSPPDYQQPPPNYQAPPPNYQQPPPNYQAPPPNYQQPPPQNYQQAPPNYQAPPPNYQQPPPNYQAPPPNYQPPPPGNPPAPAVPPTAAQQRSWQQHYELQYHPLRAQIEGGYTVTAGDTQQALNDGGNVGLGLTWFPTSAIPLGLRVDGSYSRFGERQQSLAMASQALNTDVVSGHQDIYGGDADLELDLKMGPRAREYFFGGFGWYREQTVFRQATYEQGVICYYYCTPGSYLLYSTAERSTTGWLKSWNAGLGFEFALSDPVTFFIEARYLRIEPYSSRNEFVPIRIGLRF